MAYAKVRVRFATEYSIHATGLALSSYYRNAYALCRLIGDCDGDLSCDPGLSCFQRDDYSPVPGCGGPGLRGTIISTSPIAILLQTDFSL